MQQGNKKKEVLKGHGKKSPMKAVQGAEDEDEDEDEKSVISRFISSFRASLTGAEITLLDEFSNWLSQFPASHII